MPDRCVSVSVGLLFQLVLHLLIFGLELLSEIGDDTLQLQQLLLILGEVAARARGVTSRAVLKDLDDELKARRPRELQ